MGAVHHLVPSCSRYGVALGTDQSWCPFRRGLSCCLVVRVLEYASRHLHCGGISFPWVSSTAVMLNTDKHGLFAGYPIEPWCAVEGHVPNEPCSA